MKRIKVLILIMSGWMALSVQAADDWVNNASISKVEFYGNQFTVYFDKNHAANACGELKNVVAINTASEPGKSHYQFFLTAYSTGKTVSVKVTDESCNGDRPIIRQIIGN